MTVPTLRFEAVAVALLVAVTGTARAEPVALMFEQAVYVDPKNDITDRVMKALNTK